MARFAVFETCFATEGAQLVMDILLGVCNTQVQTTFEVNWLDA